MATQTSHLAHRTYRIPIWPFLHIDLPRKDLWVSGLIFFAGLALPALMFFGIIEINLLLGLVGFLLTFLGGILFLVRLGEIA